MATTTRLVAVSVTATAACQPILPAAPSAAVPPAMWPAMAATLARAISAEPAGNPVPIYTAWATMMHRPSPQPRFFGVVE